MLLRSQILSLLSSLWEEIICAYEIILLSVSVNLLINFLLSETMYIKIYMYLYVMATELS
jgi:hypothetical protein